MALKQIRIGANEDIFQYDDADYPTAMEVDDPVRVNAAPVHANDTVRQTDVPTLANIVAAAANIADNAVVRGNGGAKEVQGSQVTIDDNGSVNIPTGQGLQVNGTQVVTDQQAAEADASDVSAIAAGAGVDTIDLATLNVDLATLRTEINNAIGTLNSLLAKLRTHGLINT